MEYTRLKPLWTTVFPGALLRYDIRCDWKAYDVLRPKIAGDCRECNFTSASNEKAFVRYSFPLWKAFLGRFQFYSPFVAHVEPIIDAISSNFHLRELRDDALASGCRSSSKREAVTCQLGTNKFSINERRATGDDRSDFAIPKCRSGFVSSSRRWNNAEICHVCDRNVPEQRIIQSYSCLMSKILARKIDNEWTVIETLRSARFKERNTRNQNWLSKAIFKIKKICSIYFIF